MDTGTWCFASLAMVAKYQVVYPETQIIDVDTEYHIEITYDDGLGNNHSLGNGYMDWRVGCEK